MLEIRDYGCNYLVKCKDISVVSKVLNYMASNKAKRLPNG